MLPISNLVSSGFEKLYFLHMKKAMKHLWSYYYALDIVNDWTFIFWLLLPVFLTWARVLYCIFEYVSEKNPVSFLSVTIRKGMVLLAVRLFSILSKHEFLAKAFYPVILIDSIQLYCLATERLGMIYLYLQRRIKMKNCLPPTTQQLAGVQEDISWQ